MKAMLKKLMAVALSAFAGFTGIQADQNDMFLLVADEHDDAQQAVQRGEIKSYSEIKRMVEGQLNGRVVDLKLRRTNKGWQYFLRVSTQKGRVVAAVVDARTGRILTTN
ncbi:MAG: hypothetical protein KUG56_06075 [Kordiimonadaceae bacterium]|nr:hypothetical protein [Kordiimonadaceae bacterium]